MERSVLTSRPATIDDVAALAGVGRTTVSRVLNDQPNVREEVRAKVRAAMEALGYEADPGARALASGSKNGIALICSINIDAQPDSYYHVALEMGAMRRCVRSGHLLTMHRIDEQSATKIETIMAIAGRGRIGLILAPPFSEDRNLLGLLVKNGNPICAISPGMEISDVASISIDDDQAGEDAALHLCALGHTRFGFVAGPETHRSTNCRLSGFRRGLARSGIDPATLLVVRDDLSFRSGTRGLFFLADTLPTITAIMCANDDVAAGALFAAHERGIAIPNDLSIMGFDDTPLSSVVWPPLTTVRQPLQEMAERAAGLVIDQDSGANILLPHQVIARASTGSVSGRQP